MIICESTQKPLILLHLIQSLKVTNALVFTKSADSTTRLVRLFEFYAAHQVHGGPNAIVARAYSSDLSPSDRRMILDKFKSQEIQMYAIYYPVYLLFAEAHGQTGLL